MAKTTIIDLQAELLEDGETVTLRLANGVVVGNVDAAKLAKAFPIVQKRVAWSMWCRKSCNVANMRFARACRTPWETKALTWVQAIRLRQMDIDCRIRKKGRLPNDAFKTAEWKNAVLRMWTQASGKSVRALSSPWKKWCASVSRNQIRRHEARYVRKQDNSSVAARSSH